MTLTSGLLAGVEELLVHPDQAPWAECFGAFQALFWMPMQGRPGIGRDMPSFDQSQGSWLLPYAKSFSQMVADSLNLIHHV